MKVFGVALSIAALSSLAQAQQDAIPFDADEPTMNEDDVGAVEQALKVEHVVEKEVLEEIPADDVVVSDSAELDN